MNDEPTSAAPKPRSRMLRYATTLLVVVLSLLAFEAFYYFSTRSMDAVEKALVAWEGASAPDFSVTNLDGQALHLADLRGKRVILNFWATWCPPCLEEIPNFIKLHQETSSTGVVIIGLTTDDAATLQTFVKRNGINYSIAQLKNVPSPYQDVIKIPVTFVIDRNGVLQHIRLGPQDLKALEKFATEPDFAGTVKPAPAAPNR